MQNDLLNPELYQDEATRTFIEDVFTCEAEAKMKAKQLDPTAVAPDNIIVYLEATMEEAKKQFLESAVIIPTYTAFSNKMLRLSMDYPTTDKGVSSLINVGKCFAFCSFAPAIFFSSLFPSDDEGRKFALSVVGASVIGNTFVNILSPVNHEGEIEFVEVMKDIVRKRQSKTIFGKLYDLRSSQEITNVVRFVPEVMVKTGLTPGECASNFAATLQVLDRFGYEK